MKKIKVKKTHSKSSSQKRGSPTWRIWASFRRLWSNSLMKIGLLGMVAGMIPTLLWWAEYPQRFYGFVTDSLVCMTGNVGFSLSEILVEGRHHAPSDKILTLIGAKRGDPLFAHNPYLIKKNLEEYSWIRQATVRRQFPGILFIQIKERQPVALWQHRQRHYLVDEQGVIISNDHLQDFAKLPIIVGGDAPVHAPHILRLLEKFPQIRDKLTALVRIGGRRWDLHLDKAIQIKLPEVNIEEAFARLTLLIQQNKIHSSEVSVVDFRIPHQMVMKLSPTASARIKGKGKET